MHGNHDVYGMAPMSMTLSDLEGQCVCIEESDGLCCRLAGACARMKPLVYDMSHSTRDRWEIDRRSVMMQQLLGEGMYGQVWQGTIDTSSLQAILLDTNDVPACPAAHMFCLR